MKRILFILAATALFLASCDQPTDSPKAPAGPTISVPTTLGDAPGIATGFGTGGVATLGSSGKTTFIRQAVVDSSFRIVAVQEEMAMGGGLPETKLVRFTEAGSLDTSFGSGGYFVTPAVATVATALHVATSGTPTTDCRSVAVDADGSVYLSGQLYSGVTGGATPYTAFLVKVTSTGSVDTSFGPNHDGYLNLGSGFAGVVHSLASGVVVSFMGQTNLGTVVEKVSSAGVASASFTVEGIPSGQTANTSAPSGQNGDYSSFPDTLLSHDGNSLYVPAYLVTTSGGSGGTLTRTLKVAKVDLTGIAPALDLSYGSNGYATTGLTPPSGFLLNVYGKQVVDNDGNVILMARTRSSAQGGSSQSAGFQLLRFDAHGTFDIHTAFDATYHYPTGDVSVWNAILAGGKLVFGGSYHATGSTTSSGCLLRFDATTGAQDMTFGTNGILKPLSSLNANSSFIMDLILDRGSILAIGNTISASSAGSMPNMTTVMVRLQ